MTTNKHPLSYREALLKGQHLEFEEVHQGEDLPTQGHSQPTFQQKVMTQQFQFVQSTLSEQTKIANKQKKENISHVQYLTWDRLTFGPSFNVNGVSI
jgi:glucose-6-phosphate isomerase